MLRSFDAESDRDIVFVPIGINYDHVLEDMNMVVWNDPKRKKGSGYHLKNLARFLGKNLFRGSDGRYARNGYASVNFGIPVSAAEFARNRNIQFHELDKDNRFPQVSALADTLMDSIKHVVPILPIPLIATVFAQTPNAQLRSAEVVTEVDDLIDQIITSGAAMKESEKPSSATITHGLKMLTDREILVENHDCYSLNLESKGLVDYYANSIAHWLNDKASS